MQVHAAALEPPKLWGQPGQVVLGHFEVVLLGTRPSFGVFVGKFIEEVLCRVAVPFSEGAFSERLHSRRNLVWLSTFGQLAPETMVQSLIQIPLIRKSEVLEIWVQKAHATSDKM